MPPFPSDAWLDSADRTLGADADLARLGQGILLVVQQTVTSADGSTAWHIRVDDGAVNLSRGPAPDATVTFTCDADTAEGIHEGTSSAQAEFMAGRLRVGGDVGVLLRHPDLLRSLAGVLGTLRTAAG